VGAHLQHLLGGSIGVAPLPLLMKADEATRQHTNVNGFWARSGRACRTPPQFGEIAVKGFTEALMNDLRLNAPQMLVVMPDHIGTSIVSNSRKIISGTGPMN
jgi:hypothetical protein